MCIRDRGRVVVLFSSSERAQAGAQMATSSALPSASVMRLSLIHIFEGIVHMKRIFALLLSLAVLFSCLAVTAGAMFDLSLIHIF